MSTNFALMFLGKTVSVAQFAIIITNQINTIPVLTTSFTSMTNDITALSGNNAISEYALITASAGTEIVPAGFVTSTTRFNTNIMDLVLVDLQVSSKPSQRNSTVGVFGMCGGNRNTDGQISYTGMATKNDSLLLIYALDNNPAKIVNQHQQ